MSNLRCLAVKILQQVVCHKQPLQQLLSDEQNKLTDQRDKDFLYALCTGAIREYITLDAVIKSLLHKSLKVKDQDIHMVLILGLYQSWYMHTPDYAAVASMVDITKALKKPWASGLVNKLLRLANQKKEELLKEHAALKAHPKWLLNILQKTYPDNWESLCETNNSQPPMTLRVNTTLITRDSYSQRLKEAGIEHSLPPHPLDSDAISLNNPTKISELPGFKEGLCYVQDLSAQRATRLLHPQANDRILDACAAPGGKTTHLLALEPAIHLTAIDKYTDRLAKIKENLDRLKLNFDHIQLKTADALTPDEWWDGNLFDHILLDAPCTATGVIRRHPESKLHREPKDLTELPKLQEELFTSLWPLLKPGGTLLYTTCSVLPHENSQVVERFLTNQPKASVVPIDMPDAISDPFGQQLLPTDKNDGFYYCLVKKLN